MTMPLFCTRAGLAISLVLMNTLSLNAAITTTQTGFFGTPFESDFGPVDSGFSNIYSETQLGGFTKFDSSLGTLTKVVVSVQIDASISVDLEATALNDELQPFTLLWDSGTSLFQASIVYKPTGTNLGLAIASDLPNVPGLGIQDGNAADWTNVEFGGNFYYFDNYFENFGGAADGASTPTTGEILSTNPSLVLSDFQGVGPVDTLFLAVFGDLDTSVVSDNVASANISLYMDANNFGKSATLYYEYNPVPEPATMTLLAGIGVGALVVLRRRRKSA